MSLQDEVQKGKDRYVGSRLREHDDQIGELREHLNRSGDDPVEVPEELAEFAREVRDAGGSDELLVAAVFDRFGLGAFSDREIAAALQTTTESVGDEPSEQEPDDESGSDEDPGE